MRTSSSAAATPQHNPGPAPISNCGRDPSRALFPGKHRRRSDHLPDPQNTSGAGKGPRAQSLANRAGMTLRACAGPFDRGTPWFPSINFDPGVVDGPGSYNAGRCGNIVPSGTKRLKGVSDRCSEGTPGLGAEVVGLREELIEEIRQGGPERDSAGKSVTGPKIRRGEITDRPDQRGVGNGLIRGKPGLLSRVPDRQLTPPAACLVAQAENEFPRGNEIQRFVLGIVIPFGPRIAAVQTPSLAEDDVQLKLHPLDRRRIDVVVGDEVEPRFRILAEIDKGDQIRNIVVKETGRRRNGRHAA